MLQRFSFGDASLRLMFEYDADSPVRLAAIGPEGAVDDVHRSPAVEILTADHGHRPASGRLAHTLVGGELRHLSHEITENGSVRTLLVRQAALGIEADLCLTQRIGVPTFTATVTVRPQHREPVVLLAVSSFSCGFTAADDPGDPLDGWEVVSGISDWFGEGRWSQRSLRPDLLPLLAPVRSNLDIRQVLAPTSTGTWSTGYHLPVGAVVHPGRKRALAWQIEHNGAWRQELGDDTSGGYLSLAGPTDGDAAWSTVLAPGEQFTTVPVTLAVAGDLTGVIGALTDHRRASRRPHDDNDRMPVVFNDYMNTLWGDPSTEKLLPLIAAAAEAGAEVFCVDAGWYDDSGNWWPTVGEWQPSRVRFPGGLGEVIGAIREHGMVPGLWLEPEVVGVNSPVAERLPAEAFLQRHGRRVVEHSRYHLDLRHPAAVAHLDEVVDRLVRDFGVGYFKFDYNIDPGPGTDRDADSPGAGLLGHNRAHLAWLDALLDRYPALIVENCSSGAMRMDWAMLSRLNLQSTSDQDDFLKYPPIAAAAPLSMLPEQAANWAYPQPGMTPEEASFCLVTSLLGRFYVSGHLNRMSDAERARVAEAVAVAKTLRPLVRSGYPFWPLGLPGWNDDRTALGLRSGTTDLIAVWSRAGDEEITLSLPHRAGRELSCAPVFPLDLPAWPCVWDAHEATLRIKVPDPAGAHANVLKLMDLSG